jgi:hypothetical protein
MQKIKIGRNEYDIKTGDYIMYNGSLYQFFTGDGRILKYGSGFTHHRNLVVPMTTIKTIDFDKMTKVEYSTQYASNLTKWVFS